MMKDVDRACLPRATTKNKQKQKPRRLVIKKNVQSAGETEAQVLKASYARGDARNSRRRAPVSIVDLLSTTNTPTRSAARRLPSHLSRRRLRLLLRRILSKNVFIHSLFFELQKHFRQNDARATATRCSFTASCRAHRALGHQRQCTILGPSLRTRSWGEDRGLGSLSMMMSWSVFVCLPRNKKERNHQQKQKPRRAS